MNYRHAFHAGNFADLVKHGTLTVLLEAMTADARPLRIVDTHAGAGAYDLTGELAGRTREAEAGIRRLMADPDAPAVFDPLKAAVRRLNPEGPLRLYPGSPLLIAEALREADRYVACELRPDDHATLVETLGRYPGARAELTDGFAAAAALPPGRSARTFVLIDPPFERSDDYDQIIATSAAVLKADQAASLAVWLPLKDLETFDSFLRRLEDLEPQHVVVAQARLKPLREPLKMNGCAMVLINPPPRIEGELEGICRWVAERLGGEGAAARVSAL